MADILHEGLSKLIVNLTGFSSEWDVLDKIFRENLNKYVNFFPRIVLWDNVVEPGKSQMTIRRMRLICWMSKAIETHWEYVVLTTLSRQQWLLERVSKLRCTYNAYLV